MTIIIILTSLGILATILSLLTVKNAINVIIEHHRKRDYSRPIVPHIVYETVRPTTLKAEFECDNRAHIDIVKREICFGLAMEMEKRGFVNIESKPSDDYYRRDYINVFRGTVNVIPNLTK